MKTQDIAVFDLDGTLISGQTQQMLVRYLAKTKALPLSTLAAVALWFLRYRLGMPVEHEQIRIRVLRSLTGYSLESVNSIVDHVFERYIAPAMRPIGVETLQAMEAAGTRTVIVSASAEPLVLKVASAVGSSGAIGTRLAHDGVSYSGQIDGTVIQGVNKIQAVTDWASERYERWALKAAYGDHRSDIPLMEKAQSAYAVCPCPALRARAVAEGWEVLKW